MYIVTSLNIGVRCQSLNLLITCLNVVVRCLSLCLPLGHGAVLSQQFLDVQQRHLVAGGVTAVAAAERHGSDQARSVLVRQESSVL